jgi:hypothetical protein
VKTQLELPTTLARQLEKLAAEQGRSVEQLIIETLEKNVTAPLSPAILRHVQFRSFTRELRAHCT